MDRQILDLLRPVNREGSYQGEEEKEGNERERKKILHLTASHMQPQLLETICQHFKHCKNVHPTNKHLFLST